MSSDSHSPREHVDRVQPETFRARALTASLTVRDLPASIAWYRDVMGFVVDQVYAREGAPRAAALKAGAVRILLAQDNGAQGWERIKGVGFSLQFTTAQDIDRLAERTRSRAGVLDAEPADTPWGARVFRVRDPDGFALVISSER